MLLRPLESPIKVKFWTWWEKLTDSDFLPLGIDGNEDTLWDLASFTVYISPNYLLLMLANKGQRMICTSYRHSFKLHYCFSTYSFFLAGRVDTVQDFLIKLAIKPRLHILKTSIFSLIYVIVRLVIRPTKIMNNLLKDCKIRTFKDIFQH